MAFTSASVTAALALGATTMALLPSFATSTQSVPVGCSALIATPSTFTPFSRMESSRNWPRASSPTLPSMLTLAPRRAHMAA